MTVHANHHVFSSRSAVVISAYLKRQIRIRSLRVCNTIKLTTRGEREKHSETSHNEAVAVKQVNAKQPQPINQWRTEM